LKIEILNTSAQHPVNHYLQKFKNELDLKHSVSILRSSSELTGGDMLFLISCNEKLNRNQLDLYTYRFTLHASNLPLGRGWSPHIWDLINGANEIWISLLDAAEEVDSGDIYCKKRIEIPKSALWDEINEKLFTIEVEMMKFAVEHHEELKRSPQDKEINFTYHRKRNPNDSEIDPRKTLIEQFNKIRVCDPNRFPAFFELYGTKYRLTLEKF